MKLLWLPQMRAVTDARNSAIHLAVHPGRDRRDDNLCTMISAFEQAANRHPAASLTPSERQEMVEFSERRMHIRYKATTDKTRARESKAASGSSEPDMPRFASYQKAFLDHQTEQIFGTNRDLWNGEYPVTRPYECTRCGKPAAALCWAEGTLFDKNQPGPGGEVDEEVGVVLTTLAFACAWCGLTLTSYELLSMESEKDSWAMTLMKTYPLTEAQYMEIDEPYAVKLAR